MKNRSLIISAIVLLVIVTIGLIAFLIFFLKNGSMKFFKFNYEMSNELVLDEKYEVNFNTLDIQADMSNIFIRKSEDDQMRVVIYGEKDRTSISEDYDTFNIKSTSKKCIGFCIGQKSAKIEIYLPSEYSNTIDIFNKYGDIEIGSFKESNINIQANCGDIRIQKAKNVDITNDFGDTIIDHVEEAKIDQSAGDIEVDSVYHLEAINNFGDIEIGEVKGYVDLEDNCGNIEVKNLHIEEDSRIKDDFGDIKIGKTNSIFIDASTSLGETNIKNNYRNSEITLSLKNNCGDITVEN